MMQRHTGGVKGTVLLRGYCPYCGRGLAGGNTERGDQRGRRLSLRPHKTDPRHPGSPWCPGGGSVVDTDHDLMRYWAQRLREAP